MEEPDSDAEPPTNFNDEKLFILSEKEDVTGAETNGDRTDDIIV